MSGRSASIRPSGSSRSATKSRRASCAGTAACASSDSSAACTKTRRRRRPTACSPTSIFRRPNSSTSRSSTSAPSTSTCTARRSCAPIWRGCSTSRAQAAAAGRSGRRFNPRGEAGQAEITAMHIRAAFEEGACGAIAFAWTDEWWRGGARRRRLGVRTRRSPAAGRRPRRAPSPRHSRTRRSRARRRGRASRSSSAPTTPPTRSRTASARSSS